MVKWLVGSHSQLEAESSLRPGTQLPLRDTTTCAHSSLFTWGASSSGPKGVTSVRMDLSMSLRPEKVPVLSEHQHPSQYLGKGPPT